MPLLKFDKKTLRMKTTNKNEMKLWIAHMTLDELHNGYISPYPRVVVVTKLKYKASIRVLHIFNRIMIVMVIDVCKP